MKSLVDIVAAERLLVPARLAAAARRAATTGEALVALLVEVEGVPEDALAAALGRRLGRPPAPIGQIDEETLREVPYDLARSRRLIPIGADVARDGARLLRVAMADPTDRGAIDEIEGATGARVEPLLARLTDVDEALRRAYRGLVTAVMSPRDPDAPHRVPFGGDLADTGRVPALHTKPFHRVEDEVPIELRHRALIELLVAKGLITQEEYLRELRKLLPSRD